MFLLVCALKIKLAVLLLPLNKPFIYRVSKSAMFCGHQPTSNNNLERKGELSGIQLVAICTLKVVCFHFAKGSLAAGCFTSSGKPCLSFGATQILYSGFNRAGLLKTAAENEVDGGVETKSHSKCVNKQNNEL